MGLRLLGRGLGRADIDEGVKSGIACDGAADTQRLEQERREMERSNGILIKRLVI